MRRPSFILLYTLGQTICSAVYAMGFDMIPCRVLMVKNKEIMQAITKVGGQYAVTSRYRHPSAVSFVAESRGNRGVFDLDKTVEVLEKTLSFIEECGKKGYIILLVSSRQETVDLVKQTAQNLSLPYMLNRWIGGTLSNFKNIRGRTDKMGTMQQEKEEGAWTKYTKKEKVLLNRELAKLENRFTGIALLSELPQAVFVLDTRKEKIAVKEANSTGVPVIGFSNADADVNLIQYPIIANIHSRDAVGYVLGLVEEAYKEGVKNKEVKSEDDTDAERNKGATVSSKIEGGGNGDTSGEKRGIMSGSNSK